MSQPQATEEVSFQGRGVSAGVAFGPAVFVAPRSHQVYRFPVREEGVAAEIGRLGRAVEATRFELQSLRRAAALEAGSEVARVFEAHEMMLTDPLFLGRVEEAIRKEKVNAEWAIERVGSELLEQFRTFETEHLRARGQDLVDVTTALSQALEGIDHHHLGEIGDSVIVIADELTPSEMIRLHEAGVGGVAFRLGGRNSHAAIVARELQIPMVVGLEEVSEELFDETPVLVDGDTGELIVHPSEKTLARIAPEVAAVPTEDVDCSDCTTLDGTPVTLRANIEFLVELEEVRRVSASGVGLYRSEFLYLEKSPQLPTEEDHYRTFRSIVEATGDGVATIRTFDLGGREFSRDLLHLEEANPALGLRGIRLTLRRLDLFRSQLRALVRAAGHGNLRVMLPLVSNFDEILAFRELFDEIVNEVSAEEGIEIRKPIPLGAMIEVPAAALLAEELARELDFLAIGTNDLIQYTLAVDRNNEHISELYQPLHPAILRLIAMTVGAGRRQGTEVALCGELGSDLRALPLLVGLGLTVFSATPRSLEAVARTIRALELDTCRQLAERAVACRTAAEVEALLDAAP